jgi:two-component system, NtrC family, sensor kinase
MKRRSKAGGKANKSALHEEATAKRRRTGPKAVPGRRSARPPEESKIARLTRERDEAIHREKATAEVLHVISRSSADTQPVFNAMLENAVRVCGAVGGGICRWDGNALHHVAVRWAKAAFAELLTRTPIHPNPKTNMGRMIRTKTVVHVPDLAAESAYIKRREPGIVAAVEIGGVRTFLAVPMLKENGLIGAILLAREEVLPFTDKQIEFMQNFAAQAVIAIENTRLLNELRESLPATLEVLRVISDSPGDLKPVFASMLQNATRLCGANFGILTLRENDAFRVAEMHNMPVALTERWQREPIIRPGPYAPLSRAATSKDVVHIVDVTQDTAYKEHDPPVVFLADEGKVRSLLIVPMLKDGVLIGALSIYRLDVNPFTGKQIELVKNFAAQAVIAIENARLLTELRESLAQQTATADVLKVISRSAFDLQAVLDTLVVSAARLCDAETSFLFRRQGANFRWAAGCGHSPEYLEQWKDQVVPPDRGSAVGRAAADGKIVHIPDVFEDPEYTSWGSQRAGGYRSVLGVPLLREGVPIGVLGLTRSNPQSFTDKQIELLTTFADQAVIAIENVRLFEAEQQRTRELSESLERQTASSEVLQVISSSPGELDPVFHTILANATRICDAKFAHLYRWDGVAFNLVAALNTPPALAEVRRRSPLRPRPNEPIGRMAATQSVVHIADAAAEQAYIEDREPGVVTAVELGGIRTLAAVPMLKDNELIGALTVYRQEVRPFSDRQIELVKNFAAQAVIAIENARLLNELRESLRRQTATADVLKVISRSAFDLKTVLDTLVEAAARLCESDGGNIAREREGVYQRVAIYGFSDEFTEYVKTIPVIPERGTATGRALLDGKVVHIPDVQADPEYTFAEAQKLGGYRTILSLPMLREGVPIGVLALTRREVRPFTDKQIELVSTFADQAAIAIENVRLFESVEARTRELAMSLDDLRNAQDRLVQTEKLASLGQLTAGIAHEIKNPLNFVNNFSAVSVELIDELREALGGVHLDKKLRAEINEIADTLQGNLDKVVQHGKRADAIVRNMLLHSRQGSGEHRPVDINALVDESLNLAYHGARAEKQGFNITLEKSFDPAAGEADLFPQEITRVLLNLISNGFYAATKRKAETNEGDYEPTLAAATKSLGDKVEISIRDNGTGIPPEVKEKLFNPFSTTKPAGEGTGLGLSISHDIVVKQHSGSIEVDTQPGEFTEFRIVLPRAAASANKSGGGV